MSTTQTFEQQTQIAVTRSRPTRVHRRVTSHQVSSVPPLPTRTHNNNNNKSGPLDYEHNSNQSGALATGGLPTTTGAIRHPKHCTRCKESSQYVKALSSRVDKIDQLVQELEKTVERITDPKKFLEEHQRKLQRQRGIDLKKLSLAELQKLVAVTTGQKQQQPHTQILVKPEFQTTDPQPMDTTSTPPDNIINPPGPKPHRPIPAEIAARREREVRKDSGYDSDPERIAIKKHGVSSTSSGLRINTMSSEQD